MRGSYHVQAFRSCTQQDAAAAAAAAAALATWLCSSITQYEMRTGDAERGCGEGGADHIDFVHVPSVPPMTIVLLLQHWQGNLGIWLRTRARGKARHLGRCWSSAASGSKDVSHCAEGFSLALEVRGSGKPKAYN